MCFLRVNFAPIFITIRPEKNVTYFKRHEKTSSVDILTRIFRPGHCRNPQKIINFDSQDFNFWGFFPSLIYSRENSGEFTGSRQILTSGIPKNPIAQKREILNPGFTNFPGIQNLSSSGIVTFPDDFTTFSTSK